MSSCLHYMGLVIILSLCLHYLFLFLSPSTLTLRGTRWPCFRSGGDNSKIIRQNPSIAYHYDLSNFLFFFFNENVKVRAPATRRFFAFLKTLLFCAFLPS